MNELIEDVELSYKLFEFAIRTMFYAELEFFDVERFGCDVQLNLPEENVAYRVGNFTSNDAITKASWMSVGVAFGSTAICLDCLLENVASTNPNLQVSKSLIAAVRNAFSHGIAAPRWHIKPHKIEVIDLSFIDAPKIDLSVLNGQVFDYSQIGGLAVWYRLKDYVIKNLAP